eukprot:m51a1_g6818 putative protein (614) ;mRNA; f:546-2460
MYELLLAVGVTMCVVELVVAAHIARHSAPPTPAAAQRSPEPATTPAPSQATPSAETESSGACLWRLYREQGCGPGHHARLEPDAETDNLVADAGFETPEPRWGSEGSVVTDPRAGRRVLYWSRRADTSAVSLVGPARLWHRVQPSRGRPFNASACLWASAWSRASGTEGTLRGARLTLSLLSSSLRGAAVPVARVAMPLSGRWLESHAAAEVPAAATDGRSAGSGAPVTVQIELEASDDEAHAFVDDVKVALVTRQNVCELGRMALALPSLAREPEGQGDSARCADEGSRRFFFAWTTDPETFGLGHLRSVESVLYHHPGACVRVYSNTLPLSWAAEFWRSGYDVRVVRYDLAALLPAHPWGRQAAAKWARGPHFHSHATDYLRWALLSTHGGVWSDTDSVLLRPLLPTERNFIATMPAPGLWFAVAAPWLEGGPCGLASEWVRVDPAGPRARARDGVQAPEGPQSAHASLAPGFMSFERGNEYVAEALRHLAQSYDPAVWGSAGPVPASAAYRSLQLRAGGDGERVDEGVVALAPPAKFIPISWQRAPEAYAGAPAGLEEVVAGCSAAVHLFGKAGAGVPLRRGSAFHALLERFSLDAFSFRFGRDNTTAVW